MQHSVSLGHPGWIVTGHSHARGQAFHGDSFLDARGLAAMFDAAPTADAWCALLPRLNGCFAVATHRHGELLAAVDRLRSIPLFFRSSQTGVSLSDEAQHLRADFGPAGLDDVAISEFRLCGYVTGAGTLDAAVRQLRPGHFLHASNESSTTAASRYYAFQHHAFFDEDEQPLFERMRDVHERTFRRLIESSQGRPIVVPLSGGYDSRLIAVSLRDAGVKDVLCYTYGTEANWEPRISRDLAAYLGFRWLFVPYSAALWQAWAATPEFNDYFSTAGNLSSVPHLQDWPAVLELKRRHAIPPDSIFVPGHTGDFLFGGHIPKWYPQKTRLSRRAILDSIYSAHYALWDWPANQRQSLRDCFDARVEEIVGKIRECDPETAGGIYEQWECEERQAKFICNAVRVYEFFGYEWRLPLWDAELMDFWSHVPLRLRVKRKLYRDFVAKHQSLPVQAANEDRGILARSAIAAINASPLRPAAKRLQRVLTRMRWRHEYEHSALGWYGVVDSAEFRRRFTGRENAHAFFALKYLAALGCDV